MMNEQDNQERMDGGNNQPSETALPIGEDKPQDRVIATFSDEDEAESNAVKDEKSETPADLPEKIEVVGVRFRTSGKVYFFDPHGISLSEGMHAVVETARGTEYGEVSFSNRPVSTKEIVLPLRQVIRVANANDDAHYADNRRREQEAFALCVSRINAYGLDMKLIDAEYTFDNSKLLFYFTAEGRVDFRELVKNLAGLFHCRIELRQLGIRDEAKLLGGLGICGRPYCCHSFLPDFVQVSIKMAKEQGLSLNAAKISGACGRLMCCLRYENDVYVEEGKRTPKVGSVVHNEEGSYTVVEAKPLTGMLKVRPVNDPDGATQILSRDAVEPGMGEERPIAKTVPTEKIAVSLAAATAQTVTGKNLHQKPMNKNANSQGANKPKSAKSEKSSDWEIEKRQNPNVKKQKGGSGNKPFKGGNSQKPEEKREPKKDGTIPAAAPATASEGGEAVKRRSSRNNRGYRGNRRGNGDRKKQSSGGEQSGS